MDKIITTGLTKSLIRTGKPPGTSEEQLSRCHPSGDLFADATGSDICEVVTGQPPPVSTATETAVKAAETAVTQINWAAP